MSIHRQVAATLIALALAADAHAQSLTGWWRGTGAGGVVTLNVRDDGGYAETRRSGASLAEQSGRVSKTGPNSVRFDVEDWRPKTAGADKPSGGEWRMSFDGPNSLTLTGPKDGGSVTLERIDDAIAWGAAAAPGLVGQAGLDCQVSEARKVGQDDKTGATLYELACKGGEGFIIAQPRKQGAPLVYSCLEAADAKKAIQNGAGCDLPDNADPQAGVATLVADRQPSCRMTGARAVGHTDTATLVEVACEGGAGYIVQGSYPFSDAKPLTITPCAGFQPGMHTQCTLTGPAEASAYMASLIVKSGKSCEPRDHRYVGLGVGLNDKGDAYFEVACRAGDGFMLDVDAAGDVYPTPCAQAGYIAGGCTLTRGPSRP